MAKSITIRNVSDETSAELAARAAQQGQSMQEYLRGQLDLMASKPDLAALRARVEARVADAGIGLTIDDVLRDRDADRR